jgi:predicted phage baseplate assembly protein
VTLPTPNLDDRRFQDLVDEAKLLVQKRCTEWTDHNVSDPGVTMIELFASMVDQLVYRLNRVPDRNYIKFLELVGVRLLPPTSAEVDVTFWLSAAQPNAISVPSGTEVATVRTETEEAILFTVVEDLEIVPCSLVRVANDVGSVVPRDRTEQMAMGRSFAAFDRPPKPGDAVLFGLSAAVPGCALVFTFECSIEGVGVDPRDPPLRWEAWDGAAWAACDVDRDETGGLNRPGEIIVHVPRTHTPSIIGDLRAGWIRCRVVPAEPGQPAYSASPTIANVAVSTIGGTTRAVHAQVVTDEIIGLSEGVAGQRFALAHTPVVPGDSPITLDVAGGSGWETWTSVASFSESGPDDRHFVLDYVGGEVTFGPAVRLPDGTVRNYGAVPPKGAPIRIREYRTGGGQQGNVARQTITVLKSSIPYIGTIENRNPATRGVDGETIDEAKVRGPIMLWSTNRAVTAGDYEYLAREAVPDVGRVRCVPAAEATDPGTVRVLVVPSVPDDGHGRLRFEELVPPDAMLADITSYLAERKVIGARVVVEPPFYQGVTVVARIRVRLNTAPDRFQEDALDALFRYFHPLVGGLDGTGWPFGRTVQLGEVYSVLERVRGTEFIEDVRLFPADPLTGVRGDPVQRLEINRNALVYSYDHQVFVET